MEERSCGGAQEETKGDKQEDELVQIFAEFEANFSTSSASVADRSADAISTPSCLLDPNAFRAFMMELTSERQKTIAKLTRRFSSTAKLFSNGNLLSLKSLSSLSEREEIILVFSMVRLFDGLSCVVLN